MILRYHGIYILKAPVDRLDYWKQYLIGRGLDPEYFTIN
jgi:hypothetical protein